MAGVRPAGFHALTVKANGRISRITTDLWVSAVPVPPLAPPLPPKFKTTALWDTGATGSVISPDIVKALSLTPVGKANVLHGGGASESPTYCVNLYLPNNVEMTGAIVTEFPGEKDIKAVIGMDIISIGDFAVTNLGGNTCMSFRAPSRAEIDYVAEAQRISFAGVSRNAPCPCGAKGSDGLGKKFKFCHGKDI